jgi:hypothetical protein
MRMINLFPFYGEENGLLMFHDDGLSPPHPVARRGSLKATRHRIKEAGMGTSVAVIKVVLAT